MLFDVENGVLNVFVAPVPKLEPNGVPVVPAPNPGVFVFCAKGLLLADPNPPPGVLITGPGVLVPNVDVGVLYMPVPKEFPKVGACCPLPNTGFWPNMLCPGAPPVTLGAMPGFIWPRGAVVFPKMFCDGLNIFCSLFSLSFFCGVPKNDESKSLL